MNWLDQNYKWVFDGIGVLFVAGFLALLRKWIWPRLASLLADRARRRNPGPDEVAKVSFQYLPANPLSNGWRLADPERPSLEYSVPPDRGDGLAVSAADAIDYDLEKYQRTANHVRFSAKLSDKSYLYAKVRLVSRDGRSVSRVGWITCDTGAGPPRKESRDEWVIHRTPGKDGWTTFDLFLPEEVSQTFGKAEGLQFSELLGFRLRGSLAVSPINVYHTEPRAPIVITADMIVAFISAVALVGFVIVSFRKPASSLPRQAEPPVVPTATAQERSGPLVAQVAKDAHALRQLNHVTRIADTESEKSLPEIPANSYGFTIGSWVADLGLDKLPILSKGGFFEIQKLADGTAMIVGYVGQESLDRLREGLAEGSTLIVYSDPWKDAPNIVAIPLDRLKCARSRTLYPENTQHKITEIEALDCDAR